MTLRDALIRLIDLWDMNELAPHMNADINQLSQAFTDARKALTETAPLYRLKPGYLPSPSEEVVIARAMEEV